MLVSLLNYTKNILRRLMYAERSPEKLALSCSIGIFIAFSPFIGFHNIMVFLLSWALKLNTFTTFAVAHINNPITTIPMFTGNYLFGKWMLNDFLGTSIKFVNPFWINYINEKLSYYLGAPKICFWTFFIGSNILGLFLAIIAYPLAKILFRKLIHETKQLA